MPGAETAAALYPGGLLRPPMLAVLDGGGVIRDVNAQWVARYEANGGDKASCGVGVDYLGVCRRARGSDSAEAQAEGLREVLSGSRRLFQIDYVCAGHEFQMSAAPMESGGAMVLHVDVTEERTTRESLARSEARFEAAALASQDPLYIHDAVRDDSGEIVDFHFGALNPAAEQQLGASEAEIRGKSLIQLYPVPLRAGLLAWYSSVVETGRFSIRELWIDTGVEVPPPGWYQLQVVPLGGGGVAVTARDVTAQKRLELELRQSREHLLDVTRAAPAVVYRYVRDRDGSTRFTLVSEAARELWGVEPDDAIADPLLVRSLTHPEDWSGPSARSTSPRPP